MNQPLTLIQGSARAACSGGIGSAYGRRSLSGGTASEYDRALSGEGALVLGGTMGSWVSPASSLYSKNNVHTCTCTLKIKL